MSDDARQARSFGAVADLYDRVRPGYPIEAAEWLLGNARRRVADVGAGTGKFTRVLSSVAGSVTAVEPDPDMRARLATSLQDLDVTAVDGSGESLPFADGTLDAVTFAQAWHWVDPERGSAEAARVLRSGGVLGLLWNIRDEEVPWVAELGALLQQPEKHRIEQRHPHVAEPFGEGEVHVVRWDDIRSKQSIVELAASRSYVITMEPDERAALLGRVRELLDSDPATAESDEVELPYVTYCHRFVRP
jgi:SAM-dependent methyltransferase